MSYFYDCVYIEADTKIDIIKDYLDSLEECDIYKIRDLAENLEWFIKHYIDEDCNNDR